MTRGITSTFFPSGFYKKARACPYRFDDAGKWIVDESIRDCNIPVSSKRPVIVEQKYNGNRGIFEYSDGKGCLFSAKKGCHNKGFPWKVARLIENQFDGMRLAGERINDVVLDGEMYLDDCGGKIPGLAKQARAIKGQHDDLDRDCTFSYKVFDILRLNGKDTTSLSLARRKAILSDVIPYTFIDSSEGISVEPVHGIVARSTREIASIAASLVSDGYEGVVVKSPASRYEWRGRDADHPSTDGWWKVKNASTVRAEATIACLGNPGKTGLNAFRYKTFQISACNDDECITLVPITDKGVSHAVPGSDLGGLERWDRKLHSKVVSMLREGTATPSGTTFRSVESVSRETGIDPDAFDALVQGITDVNGKPGLPRCVEIHRGGIVVDVTGLEFNINKAGIPKINGPPRLLSVIPGGKASTVKDIMELKSVHA